eukprot:7711898-Karenia_brevis.AAC.1
MLVMGKMCLASDQHQRLVKAMVMQTHKLTTDSWAVKSVQEGVAAYLKHVANLKDQGKSQEQIKEAL